MSSILEAKRKRRPGHKEPNSTTRVYEALRDMILERRITPGEKINQNSIAKQLKVSRTPLMQALHKLESIGFVENVPQKGFFVHKLSLQELVELFELREAMDILIVRRLAESIKAEQLHELEQVFSGIDPKRIEIKQYWRADVRFHQLLLEYCDHSLIDKVNDSLQVFARSARAGLVRKPEETLEEHKAIIAAIRNRDKAAAREAVIKHIEKSLDILTDIVKKIRSIGVEPRNVDVDELPEIHRL